MKIRKIQNIFTNVITPSSADVGLAVKFTNRDTINPVGSILAHINLVEDASFLCITIDRPIMVLKPYNCKLTSGIFSVKLNLSTNEPYFPLRSPTSYLS